MTDKTHILIADDHPLVRQGLRRAIESAPQLIVADVGDGQSALDRLRKLRPEIAVLDVNLPGLDGFGGGRAIQEEAFPVEVIFLREPSKLARRSPLSPRSALAGHHF